MMAPEKRNHFLDADDSDNDGSEGYDSEAERLTKGGRGAKRRKVDRDSSDDEDRDGASDREPQSDDELDAPTKGKSSTSKPSKGPKDAESATIESSTSQLPAELPDISRPLAKKNLVATDAAIRRSGVVYLSSVPPYMKPSKLRSLLEPYGTINRIFLSPEDPAARTRRVKAGGNKKKSFADGWIEFVRKKDAKKACELLNARNIGGKKGSYYRDDIWNLRYLTGFKWNNLTEQISAEAAERVSRMRAEISKTTKENKEFVKNLERAKMLDGMQAKKAGKKTRLDGGADVPAPATEPQQEQRVRVFTQTPLAKKGKATDNKSDGVHKALSKIF